MVATAFSTQQNTLLYGIPDSGWKSSQWNWGSSVGTGHDCARICRQKHNSEQARQRLVTDLQAATFSETFEEVKLVLALTWQQGRWSGRDGGKGGYGDVLSLMAEAQRYEDGTEEECAARFVQDMGDRYSLVVATDEQAKQLDVMASVLAEAGSDVFAARQRCSGLVLEAVGFVQHGC